MNLPWFFVICGTIMCTDLFQVMCETVVFGPPITPGVIMRENADKVFLIDSFTLPSGNVTQVDIYLDVTLGFSPFYIYFFRPVGDPLTTNIYGVTAVHPIYILPIDFVTGPFRVALDEKEYVSVENGDYVGLMNTRAYSSIPLITSLSSKFNARISNPGFIPPIGSVLFFPQTNEFLKAFVPMQVTVETINSSLLNTCQERGNSLCAHICVDLPSGFKCSCHLGFILDEDQTSCVDNSSWHYRGPKGERGPHGNMGLQGATGSAGAKGEKGESGPKGEKGERGIQGIKGEIGPKGQKGELGLPGTIGEKGMQGPVGPQGVMGPKGVEGQKGDKGDVGPAGLPGPIGPPGIVGTKGEKGDKGSMAVSGIKGQKGEKGTAGIPGIPGTPGQNGFPGPTGLPGEPGPIGSKGQKGETDLSLFKADIDECLVSNSCEQICINTYGGFHCACLAGFVLNNDSSTCRDIDECSDNNGRCEHGCINVVGAHICTCATGFTLNKDGLSCQDVDECTTDNGGCNKQTEICINEIGKNRCSPKSPEEAAVIACSLAEAQRAQKCMDTSNLLTHAMSIGFIIWLGSISLISLALLCCLLSVYASQKVDDPYARARYNLESRQSSLADTASQRIHKGGIYPRLADHGSYYYGQS